MQNKLKKMMEAEVKRVVNKYNSAVFILNGGTVTKAIELYDFKCPSKTLRAMCIKVDADGYESLRRTARWCTPSYIVEHGAYLGDPTLSILRENKHLFIGEQK